MSLTKATYAMIEGAPANVLDYGAIGNGLADDTAAIQAVLDTNKNVFFPKGTYKITSTLTVPKFTSIVGEVGSNIVADFTNTASWSLDYVALRFSGLNNVDVTPNDFNTVFANMVISSTAANTVQATAIEVPNGATSATILQSRVYCYWSNVMVDKFDTAYALNQMTNSVLIGLSARNVRVGVSIVGKSVNLQFTSLNLFEGTPATSSVDTSRGVLINSYFRSAVEERPEGITISSSLISAFYRNVDLVRALQVIISNNILDLGAGDCCVSVTIPRAVNINSNWIDCGTVGRGVWIQNSATPSDDDVLLISGNKFSRVTNAVYASNRQNIQVINNDVLSGTANDFYFVSTCNNIIVNNNNSKNTTASCVYVSDSDNITIQNNTTKADIVVDINPNATSTYVLIGRNNGAVQQTWQRGTATITSGNTTTTVTALAGSTIGWLRPRINILSVASTTSPVITSSISYGTTSSTLTLTSSSAAPAGNISIYYEIINWVYLE